MKDKEILERYKPLVPFIASLLGPSCEVLLHDVSNPLHSVIAVANGYHSGRKIGSPLTEFAQSLIEEEKYRDVDYLVNYSGASKGKPFSSSTYFIKSNDRLIGMICINRDMDASLELTAMIDLVFKQYNLTLPVNGQDKEDLNNSVESLLTKIVSETIAENHLNPTRMTKKEKKYIVGILKEKGVFTMKGAVQEIAEQLQISQPTVYRYLSENKEESV